MAQCQWEGISRKVKLIYVEKMLPLIMQIIENIVEKKLLLLYTNYK